MQRPGKLIPLAILNLVIAAGFAAQNSATVTPIFAFNGVNGANPGCVLISDSAGALYGTALGGTSNFGVVFKLSPKNGSWQQTVLYNFTGGSDGADPGAGLVLDSTGNLYGVILAGGAYNFGGIFQLKPPGSPGGAWTETVIYSFYGKSSGANPHAPLTLGSSGGLYGVAAGGSSGYGVAFQLVPRSGSSWSLKDLHTFTGAGDGATPSGALLLGNASLYGMTEIGGAYDSGTVYQLNPSPSGGAWTESVLYSFMLGSDGVFPLGGLVADGSGNLYGTTTAGGSNGSGTVFQLKPPAASGGAWTESVLYNFLNGVDGATPTGTLVFGQNKALYGTTVSGGSYHAGTVFKLARSGAGGAWTESIIYSFTGGSDGANPAYGVAAGKNGALYGTAQRGGSGNKGTIFQVSP